MKLSFERNHLWYFALVAASVAAFWSPLAMMYELAQKHEHYSHILLIPFISAGLLFWERKRIFAGVAFSVRGGIVFVAAAAVLSLLRLVEGLALSQNDSLTLAMLSLVAVWAGGFVACYGRAAARAAIFPLAFLVLFAPLPDVVLNATIRFLQVASTEATAVIFKLTGTPVYREGFIFAVPGLTIHVAEECSGIRSSMALFVTGLLAAYLFLNSPWRRVVLILFVVPITVVKNGMRIVLITLLSANVDPEFMTGPLHRRGGRPFFVLAFLVLMVVLWLLRKGDKAQSAPAPAPEASGAATPAAPPR